MSRADELERRFDQIIDEVDDINRTAKAQLAGRYSPQSDAMTALKLVERLTEFMLKSLREAKAEVTDGL
jgi:hypothetical protein